MKTICLYFQIHQPVILRKYHFFDIGLRHDYFDAFANKSGIRELTEECYIPMNNLLLELIEKYGKRFKVSFSISGCALEQLAMHAPEVIESFQELAQTGCVEFIAETYGHSLASLSDTDEFAIQIKTHAKKMKELFGQRPKVVRNSSLIYSDSIGKQIADMGFKAMITDGAKHVLGWKSPNFIYSNAFEPQLSLLLKNSQLSDDLSLRFSDRSWDEWPLTAEKYTRWLIQSTQDSDIVNIFMNYETFGHYQKAESGIFDFFRALPEQILDTEEFRFLTPSEAVKENESRGILSVPYPISWSDEEKDITGWLGNELQNEAFRELYKIQPLVRKINDEALNHDFTYLQASDHFYYMRTNLFSDNRKQKYSSPYDSPYDAFINYMNVLSDFIRRVNERSKEKTTRKNK